MSRVLSLLLLVLVALALVAVTHADPVQQRVYAQVLGNKQVQLTADPPQKWCASGYFSDRIASTGWSFLYVKTNTSCSDEDAAFAAGYLEGFLTWERIWEFSMNENTNVSLSRPMQQWVDAQNSWEQEQINAQASTNPYWYQAKLINAQFDGLYAGYDASIPSADKYLTRTALHVISSGSDLEDVASVLPTSDSWDFALGGRCSALVKLLPDFSDVFISQVTWSSFTSMTRVFKKYDFSYKTLPSASAPVVPGSSMTFSSYPASLFSGDDFYQINSGLVVQETTIGNNNATLNEMYIKPQTVFDWKRNMIANRLAQDGASWAKYFCMHNSGTYNNEFMILDYNKFVPGKPGEGTLWVLDQLPGLCKAKDLTKLLVSQQYFPSYNSPYFSDVFKLGGFEADVKKYGDWFTYDKTPRALMFKQRHSSVVDLESMQALMRYNDFKNDPLARCDCTPPYSAENAISCRDDLNPANGTYPFGALGHRNHAGTDCKISSYSLYKKGGMTTRAISSPTYDQQPVFQWSKSDFPKPYPIGQPDRWEFEWMDIAL